MAPDGAVGVGSEQLTAQHSLDLSVADESSSARAASQQFAISGSLSPVCKGKPASAPLAKAITTTKDVSHFITNSIYMRSVEGLSRRSNAGTGSIHSQRKGTIHEMPRNKLSPLRVISWMFSSYNPEDGE